MIESRRYLLDRKKEYLFHNNVGYCVGTGRMGLALQKEYQEQLALVQKEIGFQFIRGHGLFSDDMAIYQVYEEEGENRTEYNFTYLDMVMDSYLSLGIRPFLELGFMPEKMASGSQSVFYWKGNVTPPRKYEEWCGLVEHTLLHLMERYGEKEVLTWPIEVWNEPNLPGFWKDADRQEYFKLFEETFLAIKSVHRDFRVGGPAICGVDDESWMKDFMEFCHKKRLMLDFVTRHHYTTEIPQRVGHYGYAELSDAELGFSFLHKTREIVDSYEEFAGLEIHITEFNTSYVPNCPLHDTNQNAAYIAHQLSRLGDDNESYSYWTFGDIFEEFGVPFTPFHGGFGLVANGCIPKPTFWTFKFFKDLKGRCIHKSEEAVVLEREDGSFCGVIWNSTRNRSGRELELCLEFAADNRKSVERYSLLQKIVDEDTCNPLRHWHNMGEPSQLSVKQRDLLRESARPSIESRLIEKKGEYLGADFRVKENGVIYFELTPFQLKGARGYDYFRVMQMEE